MGGVIDTITGRSGSNAARDSLRASEIAASGEREALDYLKETEALPLELRNEFLPQLADVYRGGEGQQQLIDQAKSSPLYDAIMGERQAGEQSILRNAAATGGLRSGNDQGALTDYGSQLENRALLTSYNDQLQGIQSLANQPLNTNAIASATAAPSRTQAQGVVAAAQARQQADQAVTNNLFSIGGAALKYSDIRLKDDVEYVGIENGHNIYTWKWNKEAEELGLFGKETGVMAHEIYDKTPELVGVKNGYIVIDYQTLGLEDAA